MGHLRDPREPSSTCCPTSPASTRSSSAAGRATCPPGSPGCGARPVGIDNSAGQLATARILQAEFGIEFPLIHGNAETVPLPDASFDLAISEYGAVLWADPERWVPEAARLLRPGGRLIGLTNSVLAVLAMPDLEEDGPATDRLLRPQRIIRRMEWDDGDRSVEFHPSHGDWVRIFRANGFEVEDAHRALRARGRHDQLPVDVAGMGQPMAGRGRLEGPQARLRPTPTGGGPRARRMASFGRRPTRRIPDAVPPITGLTRIEPVYLDRLEKQGVFTTGILLEVSETPTRRQYLADHVGADLLEVLTWRDEALMLNLAAFGPAEHLLALARRLRGAPGDPGRRPRDVRGAGPAGGPRAQGGAAERADDDRLVGAGAHARDAARARAGRRRATSAGVFLRFVTRPRHRGPGRRHPPSVVAPTRSGARGRARGRAS